jgi:hypothetical protein
MNRERKARPHPNPLPRGEGEAFWRIRRSWSQCMCERKLRLLMNMKYDGSPYLWA